MPTVAIIGASTDRKKFGNKAVRAFSNQGFTVFPVHPAAQEIEGHKAYPNLSEVPVGSLDAISVYVPPSIGIQLVGEMARKRPKKVWLNPGAESPELIESAKLEGLPVIAACSILGIGENPSDY